MRCIVCGGDHQPSASICDADGMDREIARLGTKRWNALTAHVSRVVNHDLWRTGDDVCIICGVIFTVPSAMRDHAHKEGGYFHCRSGHPQGWSKEKSEHDHSGNTDAKFDPPDERAIFEARRRGNVFGRFVMQEIEKAKQEAFDHD